MIKELLRPVYHATHDLMFKTISLNPLFRGTFQGQPVARGFISDEHLEDPTLDDKLANDLEQAGIPVMPYHIDRKGYRGYLKKAVYPVSYYGGGKDAKQNFTEKTLEHYVSLDLLELSTGSVFIDVAAATSLFYKIVKKLKGVKASYCQDLVFPKGIRGSYIGGPASEIPLDPGSVDAITLHCSLEHFEGNDDTEFFRTAQKLLKPGGKVVVLPFYLAGEYTIHIDPVFNFLKRHRPRLDPEARLRYCDWYQYFSRHLSVSALQSRIMDQCPRLQLTVYRAGNFRDVDPGCYLRFAGVFQKQ